MSPGFSSLIFPFGPGAADGGDPVDDFSTGGDDLDGADEGTCEVETEADAATFVVTAVDTSAFAATAALAALTVTPLRRAIPKKLFPSKRVIEFLRDNEATSELSVEPASSLTIFFSFNEVLEEAAMVFMQWLALCVDIHLPTVENE